MPGVDVTIFAESSAPNTKVTVRAAARVTSVKIERLRFEVDTSAPGIIALRPSNGAMSLSNFELPPEVVGRMELQVYLSEPVMLCGNEDTILIVSPEEGPVRSVILRCQPSSFAALKSSVELTPPSRPL